MHISSFLKQLVTLSLLLIATHALAISEATSTTSVTTTSALKITKAAKAPPVRDADILKSLTTKLSTDSATAPALPAITTSVTKGTVTYTGMVNSNQQMLDFIELAQSTDGVKDVNTTQLAMKDGKPLPTTDEIITTKVTAMLIRAKLLANPVMENRKINIETKDNVVYLTGAVANDQQLKDAYKAAKKVVGVKDVLNNLRVMPSP